jgi:hypothetical protein
VHQARAVRGGERARDIDEPFQSLFNGRAALRERRAQGATHHVLHHDERRPGVLAEIEEGDHVRVIQSGRHARLAEHALGGEIGLRARGPAQHLEGHPAVQHLVVGAVDLPHAALAEERFKDITADPLAHGCGG